MPFNPFNNSEETSFEQGSPVTQAAKNVTKAASSAVKVTAQDIVKQLYGIPTTPSAQEPGTDEANPQAINHANLAQIAGAKSSSGTSSANQSQPLEEQAKLEKLRQELFGNYSAKFKSAPNNVGNITTDVEQEMEKARQERKQREQERKQQEEEEARQQEEAKKAQQQEQVSPAGKKTGATGGRKQQQPIALRQAKTKTEINRGTTG